MLTKILTAAVMSGALWVAGDAAYQRFGCCHLAPELSSSPAAQKPGKGCEDPNKCCSTAKKAPKTSCCGEAD